MKSNILLIVMLLGFKVFSQTGEIKGKLLLQDTENIESVLSNTYIILKTKTGTDSVRLNKDLNFKFQNVGADTVRIYIRPRNYPFDSGYKFYFNGKSTKKIKLTYTSACPFGKRENNICPVCKNKDKVISIRYGLIAEIRDKKRNLVDGKGNKLKEEKYKSGGCIVSDCQPNWYCERDKKEF